MERAVPIALTIAGFDPSSGAGITADLAVFAAHGVFGVSAITALTAQSTVGVRAIAATAPEFLAETLAELAADLPPAGIKVGMLATASVAHAVADFLERLSRAKRIPIVIDPVLISSSGRTLLEPAGVRVLTERLMPLATWVTPNRREWEVLTGTSLPQAFSQDALEKSALESRARWPQTGFAVTGGDGERPDDLVLAPNSEPLWLHGEKIASSSTHGTGCAFSSALLCGLLQGMDGTAAARSAKSYVAQAIRRAAPLGHGRGPMNLLWPLKLPS